jgi:hypothetical protein
MRFLSKEHLPIAMSHLKCRGGHQGPITGAMFLHGRWSIFFSQSDWIIFLSGKYLKFIFK